MKRLNSDIWGAALVAIAIVSLFVNKGDTPGQRKAHRMFRFLLAVSALNFTFASMIEPYRTLQRVAPLANNLLIRWLIASIFFMPAWPVAETALMRETRTPEKNRALLTDYTLALLYSIAVAGALAIAVVTGS
jgi:hypothetical protein